jgi:hypothetical protein
MNMRGVCFLFPTVVLLLGACATEQTVTKTKVKKDMWGNDESFSIGKDADGNPMMKSDKRSSFENKKSNLTKNCDFSGKDYTKKSYRKERWGGKRSFGRKKFEGNTDANRYRKEPWFVKKQAAGADRQALASNKKFSVNPFRSGTSSSSATKKRYSTFQNPNVSKSRRSFPQPDITDWKNQKGLSVKDTNGMLGR